MKIKFLSGLLFVVSFSCINLLQAQTDHIGSSFTLPAHPRILLFSGEEENIRKNIASDKSMGALQQSILQECDALIKEEPLKRIQIGRRLLSVSREELRRIFLLSYAYRITNEKAYLQRAEKELMTIAAFTDWNPSHFLDVAEMTMAVAIGYDWLNKDLSADAKTAVREAILKKGLQPSMDSKYNSWLKVSHNWNQVCNAGMTYGAMAIYEDQPELAKTIINRAIGSIELPMEDYAPDGAYPEGYGYWGYGTSFNVMFISAVEKLFGKDFGLTAKPGFLKTAGYLENMTGPSGFPFNYSDAGNGGDLQPAMFWFAARTKDPSLLWVERSRLMNGDPKRFVRNRLLPGIMLWTSNIGINNITPPKATTWVGHGKNPVALMRTSWTDSLAVFVGLKAGSPSVNHGHMDVGSFIMEADGVRWGMDFGMQEYESLESKGLSIFGHAQDAVRWRIFRYNNFVHNTLTVNDSLQRVDGYAPINSSSSSPAFMNAITDISAVYKGSLAKANRGVAIVDKRYVVVRDELETSTTESTIRWTLLTPADVKITGKNSAELTKNGKKLTLTVLEPATVTMKTWTTVPPKDYDAPNPGTALVGFEVKIPANTKAAISVTLVPGSSKGATKKVEALSGWSK